MAGDQAGRGWAKEEAVGFYQQALDLVGDGDQNSAARSPSVRPSPFKWSPHVLDADLLGQSAGRGALVQREVVRRDVARDLVDPFDIVEAELFGVGPDIPRSALRRCSSLHGAALSTTTWLCTHVISG